MMENSFKHHPSLTLRITICIAMVVWLSSFGTTQDSRPASEDLESKIAALAKDQKLSSKDASSLLRIMQPCSDDRTRIFVPSPSGKGRTTAANQTKVAQKLDELLKPLAESAFQEAEQAFEQEDYSLCYQSIFKTLAFDPNHSIARNICRDSVQALSTRKVQGKAEQDVASLNWEAGTYSRITTPHFEILSRGPSKTANELADLCEQTYCAWQQVFFDYWGDFSLLGEALRGKAFTQPSGARFQVVLFKSREEYIQQLQRSEPNIGISLGYYSPKAKTSFFFWKDEESLVTMRHELVHQFFQESSQKKVVYDENMPGIWAVEGIACYMESLTRVSDWSMDAFELGGWDANRVQSARFRRLHEESWIPFDELHSQTATKLKTSSEIGLWYSQASGLVHMWMDSSPKTRRGFAKYLQTIYEGMEEPSSLDWSSDDEQLRMAYQKFLMVSAEKIKQRTGEGNTSTIVLTHCDVANSDLLSWPQALRKLDWLDVAFTKVNDDLWNGEAKWDIKRLDVEGTQTTDAAIPAIASMPRLEKLYLSGCPITDDGLKPLSGNTKLKHLWLNGTQVTDESFEVLKTLRGLEELEVSNTKISDATIKKLRKALPKWKGK